MRDLKLENSKILIQKLTTDIILNEENIDAF